MNYYAIQVLEKIDDVYTWKFDTLHEAKAVAKKLSEKHKVEVIVYKIMGSFKPTISCDDMSVHSTYIDILDRFWS